MDGVLVIDKPPGPTSHDIVARARRALGERRVGHTGTLDPAASGVLPLVLGKATRLARFLTAGDKSYDAVVRLGFATDTADAGGRPLGTATGAAMPAHDAIDAALDEFRGTFLQQPPAYSAKKIEGRRSYALARAGSATLPEPASVTAYGLQLMSVEEDLVTIRIECSAGFYVRALAHDLGERLGTGGHLASLRRTRSGDYSLSDAIPVDAIERGRGAAATGFVPLAGMLTRLASVVLTAAGAKHALQGRQLGPADLAADRVAAQGRGEWIRLLTIEGELVGLARPAAGSGLLHPSVVLI